jgi:hypothetical protein
MEANSDWSVFVDHLAGRVIVVDHSAHGVIAFDEDRSTEHIRVWRGSDDQVAVVDASRPPSDGGSVGLFRPIAQLLGASTEIFGPPTMWSPVGCDGYVEVLHVSD